MGRTDNDTFWSARKIHSVATVAEEAFWAEVAKAFPNIKTGDLSPDSDIPFRKACRDVIRAWLEENTPEEPELTADERGTLIAAAAIVRKHGPQASPFDSEATGKYLEEIATAFESEPRPGWVTPESTYHAKPQPEGSEQAAREDWHAFVNVLPSYKGWTPAWEYPGFLMWHHDELKLRIVATPDWETTEYEISIDAQDVEGERVNFGGKSWDRALPWPKATRNVETYMHLVAPVLDELNVIIEEYKNAAERLMVDAALEREADFDVEDFIVPIQHEAPGAWVRVSVWINEDDLTFEKGCKNCSRPLDNEGQCRAGCSQEDK